MGEISQHENTHSMRENPKGNKEIWESRETSSIIQKRKKNIGILKEQPLEREMKVKTLCLRQQLTFPFPFVHHQSLVRAIIP